MLKIFSFASGRLPLKMQNRKQHKEQNKQHAIERRALRVERNVKHSVKRNLTRKNSGVLGVSVMLEGLMAKLKSFLFAWMFPCIIFCVWLVIAHFEWIPSQILPAPSLVASTFTDLWASGELQGHIGISLQRVMSGFGVGALTGLLLGTAMGLSPTLKDYVYPIFKLYSQVPMLGWLPLLIMLVGIDEALKIILISKGAFVPVTLNTYKGLQGVPSIYIEVARVYRFTKWQLLKKVVFPSALPPIWMGLRHGLTHAWLALVAVELLASSEGLGFLMVYGRQLYQLDVVLVAVVIVGGIGLIFDKLLSVAETYLLRWRHDAF